MNRPQNVYDDPAFFAGYSRMERFGPGWTKAVEQPFFLSLLPDLAARRVLDLGCGAGQLAQHIARAGASEVIALDVSERMLAIARADFTHPRVAHRRQSIEEADFPDGRFDLVVSSLAFHYVADYGGLTRRIAGWLTPEASSSSRPSTPSTPPAPPRTTSSSTATPTRVPASAPGSSTGSAATTAPSRRC